MCTENDYVLMLFVRKYCELTDRDIKDMHETERAFLFISFSKLEFAL